MATPCTLSCGRTCSIINTSTHTIINTVSLPSGGTNGGGKERVSRTTMESGRLLAQREIKRKRERQSASERASERARVKSLLTITTCGHPPWKDECKQISHSLFNNKSCRLHGAAPYFDPKGDDIHDATDIHDAIDSDNISIDKARRLRLRRPGPGLR